MSFSCPRQHEPGIDHGLGLKVGKACLGIALHGLPAVGLHLEQADAGKAEKIMGTQFIRRYSLPSASAVQSSVKKLMEADYVTFFEGIYSIPDVLFRMYLKRIGGKE